MSYEEMVRLAFAQKASVQQAQQAYNNYVAAQMAAGGGLQGDHPAVDIAAEARRGLLIEGTARRVHNGQPGH